jgi:archaeal flagellar protein FlaJ
MAKIRFRPVYILSILLGLFMIFLDITFLYKTRLFFPVLIFSLVIMSIHFWIDFFAENNRQKQVELMFLEFMRSLTESVKSGISIPRSIENISTKDYGALKPHVTKLANQLNWGIPTRKAFQTFAEDTENKVIKRSISIMVEAEQSGGDISDIITSVVDSVLNIKKMREERKASTYSQIVQGYVIFYAFIAIMLILQLWLFPKLTGIGSSGSLKSGLGGIGGVGMLSTPAAGGLNLNTTFFSLVMIQGFFAGIMIGKFSEGSLKTGILHSLIMMITAALIITSFGGI